jgi:hypothetical protein
VRAFRLALNGELEKFALHSEVNLWRTPAHALEYLGRLLGLVKLARPNAEAVAVDFSDTMLRELRERFGDDRTVSVVAHDLDQPHLFGRKLLRKRTIANPRAAGRRRT